MLKRIPPIISPELLLLLAEMGHGDELVLADANFPAVTNADRLARADGHGVPILLEAILQLFPLDSFVEQPAAVMRRVDQPDQPAPIWTEFQRPPRQRRRSAHQHREGRTIRFLRACQDRLRHRCYRRNGALWESDCQERRDRSALTLARSGVLTCSGRKPTPISRAGMPHRIGKRL